MLQITHRARAHLIRVRRERGIDDGHAARFVENDGKVRLTFAAAAEPGDREVSAKEIRVLLVPELADRLTQAVIDTRREDDKDVLVIKRRSGSAHA